MAPSNGERGQVHFINGRFGSTVNPQSAVRNVGFAARFGQGLTLEFSATIAIRAKPRRYSKVR